jgi:hypothetical protein
MAALVEELNSITGPLTQPTTLGKTQHLLVSKIRTNVRTFCEQNPENQEQTTANTSS